MSGQPNVPGWFTFNVTSIDVEEVAGPTTFTPSTIIPRNGTFKLGANFEIGEVFGRGMNDLATPSGQVFEYNVSYFAQMIGGPAYKQFPLAVKSIVGTYSYGPLQTSYTVPPNTMDAGTYKLTCMVKMSPVGGGSGGFPWHVTGFVDGPMIEIFLP
jgi:hypothetical protein